MCPMEPVGLTPETAASPSPLDRRHTMSELDARYAREQDTRRMFGGGTITSAGSAPGAWEVVPDLERILGEALFGTIWRRDALSPVQREMITLSTLVVLAHETQLRRHLGNALHIGLTPEQIVELVIHDTWYRSEERRVGKECRSRW